MRQQRVLVSAHRCNTVSSVDAALALGVDLVEFDVQRDPDGWVFVGHDLPGMRGESPEVADVVARLASGTAVAHVDLKFGPVGGSTAPHVAAVRTAVDRLGADRVVVTTRDDAVVRGLRDWADAAGLDVRLALSLGGSQAGHPPLAQARARWSELFPERRMTACGADVVCAQWVVAALGARRYARRAGLPLLVWTVDPSWLLRWWLRRERAWAVTTNRPAAALRLRG